MVGSFDILFPDKFICPIAKQKSINELLVWITHDGCKSISVIVAPLLFTTPKYITLRNNEFAGCVLLFTTSPLEFIQTNVLIDGKIVCAVNSSQVNTVLLPFISLILATPGLILNVVPLFCIIRPPEISPVENCLFADEIFILLIAESTYNLLVNTSSAFGVNVDFTALSFISILPDIVPPDFCKYISAQSLVPLPLEVNTLLILP